MTITSSYKLCDDIDISYLEKHGILLKNHTESPIHCLSFWMTDIILKINEGFDHEQIKDFLIKKYKYNENFTQEQMNSTLNSLCASHIIEQRRN